MTERSFQERYYLHTPGIAQRLGRDIRLLAYIGKVIFYWGVVGARVRWQYRKAERSGDTYWLESLEAEDI